MKNEDLEDTSSEEPGTQRTASILAADEPYQSTLYSAVRFLISREVLALHLMWLLVLAFSIFCLRFTTSGTNCANSILPSDEVFGKSACLQSRRGIGILLNLLQYPIEPSNGKKIWVS